MPASSLSRRTRNRSLAAWENDVITIRPMLLALFVSLLAVGTGKATSRDEGQAGTRQILVESDGQPLRDVLEQVLDGTGVSIEWRSRAAAEAPIRARAAGLPEDVASRLLRGANIVEFYAEEHDGLRLRRIVVISMRGQPKAYAPSAAQQRLRVTRAAPGTLLDRQLARMRVRSDRIRQVAEQSQKMASARPSAGKSFKMPPAETSGPSPAPAPRPGVKFAPPRQLWPPVAGTRSAPVQ
jgi:hypothetical protein